MGDCITTYTGRHFDPLNPDPEQIVIDDISHALSLICRGNGQVKYFYSVGEHCINCALEAEQRGYSNRIILGCLLHDASESYMSDVPRPFKKYLKDYQLLEDRLLSCIYKKFLGTDLEASEAARIKEIDNDVLAYDLFYLLGEGKEENLPPLKRKYVYGKAECKEVEALYHKLFECYSDLCSK